MAKFEIDVRKLAKEAGLTNTRNSPVLFHGTFATISKFAELVVAEKDKELAELYEMCLKQAMTIKAYMEKE